MPHEERASRATGRCSLHPARSSVARCDRCGRNLCLACAVPVRGEVLGHECLSEALGREGRLAEHPGADRHGMTLGLSGVAFALALLSTFLPWSRFGVGSGVLGAWGLPARWSVLAGVSAAAGLAVWLSTARGEREPSVISLTAMRALAALASLATLLAILRPPAFTRPSIVPWLTLLAAAAALGLLLATSSRPREKIAARR